MAITKINAEAFVSLSKIHPVIDVRSEGEYQHAHIPSAYSLPLFNNEERKVVGTAYKQQSREAAIKIGLDFFGKKMRAMVEEVERLTDERSKKIYKKSSIDPPENYPSKTVLIHCWRGGMRSGAVAWLLDLYGFKVYSLSGGYKAFRNWVLQQFEKEYNFRILGGYTGSGKTYVLHELKNKGEKIIDLEKLANHKGSAFGNIGFKPQPSQEMFENMLAVELDDRCEMTDDGEKEDDRGQKSDDVKEEDQQVSNNSHLKISPPAREGTDFMRSIKSGVVKLSSLNSQVSIPNAQLQTTNHKLTSNSHQLSAPVWLEDESQRIGLVNIPNSLWKTMRQQPVYFLNINFEERLKHIVKEYGKADKEKLVNAILRIQKRLGGLETKTALNFLVENDVTECFRILLFYYDKQYEKALKNRDVSAPLITKVECEKVDAKENAKQLLHLNKH
jgi:tRNA 2-selenouridine synthase SelU